MAAMPATARSTVSATPVPQWVRWSWLLRTIRAMAAAQTMTRDTTASDEYAS